MTETTKRIIALHLVLISFTVHSQTIKTVRDSLTNEPIPYVNIWIENEMIGTTTNEKGEYNFSKNPTGKMIVYSSVGYKPKRTIYSDDISILFLQPETTQLKEVIIRGERSLKRIELGGFNKSKIKHFFGCAGHPWMIAKFFPFEEQMTETPFLEKVEIVTSSSIKESQFNLRLYSMNQSGVPGNTIYNENIIVTAKKGTNITTVNINDLSVEIPKTGILIVIEFLTINSNKYEYEYTMRDSKKKLTGLKFEPSIGTIPVENGGNSWQYNRGTWYPTSKAIYLKQEEYKDKFPEPAIKITLTN